MERSRSYTGDMFTGSRSPAASLMGARGRSATLGLGGGSPCPPRSTTPAMDFLSPHYPHSARASLSPSPAFSTASYRDRHEGISAQFRLPNQNPFYDHAQFRQYRSRQEQKEEKDGQKWPPILENPFLDALLLIPDMGRSKYFMHGSLYGRNMIISTYVWMSYCRALPPRATPNPVNRRDRKAISSHIQVLKNFFKEHRFYEEQRRGGKDDNKTVESLSLKTNPVLTALSANRFPDVRPNHEYFAHLLAQNSTVSIRPKTCWIFVSDNDAAVNGQALDHTENALGFSQYYPHQSSDDTLASRRPGAARPLHEYTNAVSQTYSGPVKEVTKHWDTYFPELSEMLNLPEPQHEDSLTILEMNVTLELHKQHFPSGSELNGLVEMGVAHPSLQNHQWKCVTRLVRPQELCPDQENPATYLEHTNEAEVQSTHQAGCADIDDGCDCMTKPRHDVRVPFPAAEWAGMLTNCASYPGGAPQETRRCRSSSNRSDSDSEGASGLTQGELLSQIGMFQELWSSPSGGDGADWTRRALIFWKFRDVHRYSAKKKKWVAEAPTTQWRFLTVNDPTSEYHMRNAYVYTAEAEAPVFASPGSFQEGLTPGDDFMSWNMNASLSNHMRSVSASTGSFHMEIPEGLATLPSAYPPSLDSSQDLSQSFGLMASSCSTESHDGSFVEDLTPDFLSDGLGIMPNALSYDAEMDPTLQGWEADMKTWVPNSELGVGLASTATSEWEGKELWATEEEWTPPLHMSMRPEWDEVKEEEGAMTPEAVMGSRVLGKRTREGFEGVERPTRRPRTEAGLRSVIGRA